MNLIVYIGRFQPFHNGHLKQIQDGMKDYAIQVNGIRLLMLLGTSNEGRTLKNPFTFNERKEMILNSLEDKILHNIAIEPVYDTPSDKVWQYNVIQLVNKYKVDYFNDNVYLIGNIAEKSSYYLDKFPEWAYTGIGHTGVHATDVRNAFFNDVHEKWEDRTVNQVMLNIGSIVGMVPTGVYNYLKNMAVDKELLNLARSNR